MNQIWELWGIGRQIEEHYEAPQDIEWTCYEGKFYIVQTRPITTSSKVKEGVLDKVIRVKGAAASFGMATGPVRVVDSLSQLDLVEVGDVLVTTMTSPDYNQVFDKIVGLVTDFGGSTCHAAIISREHDLPCVVGTGAATKALQNGEIVTVDGGNGLVYQG